MEDRTPIDAIARTPREDDNSKTARAQTKDQADRLGKKCILRKTMRSEKPKDNPAAGQPNRKV